MAKDTQDRLLYVYAEYCPGDFFWGWWLYAVPLVEGKPDLGKYTWLRHLHLTEILRAVGLQARDHRSPKTYEEFLAVWPNGALIRKVDFGYELVTERAAGVELWRFLRSVREDQLLKWKNADTSYLAWVESEKKKEQADGKNTA